MVAGWEIAQGELFLMSLAVSATALWVGSRLAGIRADALVAGLVIVGYLVGNRGFAQLHMPGLPLFPGEAALALGLALLVWHAVRTATLPLRRDALNACVFVWILVGLIRVPLDIREFGFLALRDFASVYYALFFFLGQAWAGLPAEQRWVRRCLLLGLALTAPTFYAFDRFPDWVTANLTLGGFPLVFVKSDVAGGFMAAGALWFAHRFAQTGRMSSLLVSALALSGVIVCNSRAAIIAFAVGVLWIMALRVWPLLRVLGALLLLGFGSLCVQAVVTDGPWVATPLYRIYESTASVADTDGLRVYRAANLDDKSDNNQFRLVWWRAVVDETWANGRWFGLGFGHDLAAEFLRIYYADSNDEFTARSPHNFLLTVFGRMGLVGATLLLAILAGAAKMTWRAGRHDRGGDQADSSLPLWLAMWTILASACFGVVLEGPMGATVFWTVLGMANATGTDALATEKIQPNEAAAPIT